MTRGLLLVLMHIWAASAWAQPDSPTIGNARFAEDPQHTFGAWGDVTTLSGDGRTLTTTMPPNGALNSNLTAEVEISYEPRLAGWYPPISYTAMSYADGTIQMTYQSNSVTGGIRIAALTANKDKLKALDGPRVYRFRFDPGPSPELVWEMRPYEGPNLVVSIALTPATPGPGDVVELEITLDQSVSAPDGQQIAWKFTPADGVAEVRGSGGYNSNGLNWMTIPQGQQAGSLVVRLSSSIDSGTTARIETWPRQDLNTLAGPAYQSRTFTIGQSR